MICLPVFPSACRVVAASLVISLSLASQDAWTTAHIAPAGGLSTRMCFHEADRRIVTVSPRQDGAELETWEWDGANWWHREVSSPDLYQGFEMVYDAGRRVVVLFGGITGPGRLSNDVWEWDGVRWTKRLTGVSPSPRSSMGLVYDRVGRRVLMYGGDSGAGRESDLWSWDGTSWRQLPATRPSPGAMAGMQMAFDTRRGVVVAFGGIGLQPFFSSEVWEFDGNRWTQPTPANRPPASRGYAMAFDSLRNVTILYGGDNPAPPTWEWDGVNWSSPTTAATPGPRLSPGFAFDPIRNQVVLHGGQYQTDTWTLDPATANWSRVAYVAPRPSSYAVLANDGVSKTLYFDGTETYLWDHALRTWATASSAVQPSLSLLPTLSFDTRRREGVLFGGLRGGLGETWIWSEARGDWQQRAPTFSPPPVRQASSAYDPVRGRVVLFGGFLNGQLVNDTYEWDGLTWARMTPASRPSARVGSALAFDPSANRVTLYGGQDGGGFVGDVWDWDGSDWVPRSILGSSPSERASTGMVGRRDGLIVVGGVDAAGFSRDSWLLRGNRWTALRAGTPSLRRPQVSLDATQQELSVFGGDSFDTVPFQALFTGGVWVYGIPRASVQPVGAGCLGTTGRPELAAVGVPFVGNSAFGLDGSALPANQLAALAVSPTLSLSELPSGCRLYLDRPSLARLSSASAAGTVRWTLPVPSLPALMGVEIYAQGATSDPANGGLILSGSLRLRLGR